MSHRISTFVLCLALAFFGGIWFEKNHTTAYIDVAKIERRLREVFCEQALYNGMAKKCDPTFPRYHQD